MTLPEQIALFSRWLEDTDIELLELTTAQGTIRLRREPGGDTAPAATNATVPSPSVGIFRRAHPSQSAPLAQPGQRVAAGEPLALLQIGALLVHVAALHAGTVLDILAEDGSAVGYGTALVRLTEEQ